MSYRLDYSEQVRLGYVDPEEKETMNSKTILLTKDEKFRILFWYSNAEFNEEQFLRLSKKGLIYDTGNCYELTDIGEYILDQLEEDESYEVFDIVFELEEEQNKDNMVSADQVLQFLKEGLGPGDTLSLPRGFSPRDIQKTVGGTNEQIWKLLKELQSKGLIIRTGETKFTRYCLSEFKDQVLENFQKEQEMRAKAYEERKKRSKLESQT